MVPPPVYESTWHFLHHFQVAWPGAAAWLEMVYMALADRSWTPLLARQTESPPKKMQVHLEHHFQFSWVEVDMVRDGRLLWVR